METAVGEAERIPAFRRKITKSPPPASAPMILYARFRDGGESAVDPETG